MQLACVLSIPRYNRDDSRSHHFGICVGKAPVSVRAPRSERASEADGRTDKRSGVSSQGEPKRQERSERAETARKGRKEGSAATADSCVRVTRLWVMQQLDRAPATEKESEREDSVLGGWCTLSGKSAKAPLLPSAAAKTKRNETRRKGLEQTNRRKFFPFLRSLLPVIDTGKPFESALWCPSLFVLLAALD